MTTAIEPELRKELYELLSMWVGDERDVADNILDFMERSGIEPRQAIPYLAQIQQNFNEMAHDAAEDPDDAASLRATADRVGALIAKLRRGG